MLNLGLKLLQRKIMTIKVFKFKKGDKVRFKFRKNLYIEDTVSKRLINANAVKNRVRYYLKHWSVEVYESELEKV